MITDFEINPKATLKMKRIKTAYKIDYNIKTKIKKKIYIYILLKLLEKLIVKKIYFLKMKNIL